MSEPLKVCIVTTAFPRWPNDSRGPSMLETARALRDRGVRVRVLTLHSPGARIHEWMEEIEVIRSRYMWPERLEVLQNEGGGLPAIWRKGGLARLAFGPFFVALALAVMRYGREFDVLHAHWTLAGAAAWLGEFYHRRPVVLTVHGSDIFQAPRIPLVGTITQYTLRRSQSVIAVSRSLAAATVALGLAPSTVEVIPDGIDISRFQAGPERRDPLLLFVGSLIERKGVNDLLKALPRVFQRFPECRVVVAGDGPQRAELESLALALQVSDRVTFVGAQSQAQIGEWMRRARLFVLPSLEEALGIVLLEALASGTPCIATRVGGIPEIVSPEVGRLVSPRDPEALAAAVIALLGDEAAWDAMRRRARAHVLENCYTWNKVASRLIDIYQAALRNP